MAAIWKPTQAECDLIRAAAARAAGTKAIRLEPGIRGGDSSSDVCMNIARVTICEDWSEDTELEDFGTWSEFRKGVELTEDGRAIVDFYVHDRVELNTNVVAYYQGGQLVEVCNTSDTNLLHNGLQYVAVKMPVGFVADPVVGGWVWKSDALNQSSRVIFDTPEEASAAAFQWVEDLNRSTCSNEFIQGVCHGCGRAYDVPADEPMRFKQGVNADGGVTLTRVEPKTLVLGDKTRVIDIAPIDNPTAPLFAEVVAPALNIDKLLYTDRGHKMGVNARLERRIVANLIAFMEYNGWSVESVYDGEETEQVDNMVEAMELIFNLDECRLYFTRDGNVHGVLLVLANGIDLIADWGYAEGDADKFNETMEAFDPESFA